MTADPLQIAKDASTITFGFIGGIALFLFGMQLLTDGVQKAINPASRVTLRQFTRHPVLGFLEGLGAASLIQSGPVIVTLLGFINAGIVTFPQSIGVLMGASVGSTISMQLLALDIGVIAYAGIAIGFIMRKIARNDSARSLGVAIVGLGLLFLGIQALRHAFDPLRASGHLEVFLSRLSDGSLLGTVEALLVAAMLAALVQSSGAVIAVIFSLAGDGGFSAVGQVIPLLAGAHIGGSAVSFWGSLGMTADAKRTAAAHLTFNIVAAGCALTLGRWYASLVESGPGISIGELAHLNTLMQAVPALALLPVGQRIALLAERLLPEPENKREQSHLDTTFIATPERAILAASLELRRQAIITARMLELTLDAAVSMEGGRLLAVERDEATVNTIRRQLKSYLQMVAGRRTTQRQAILLQFLTGVSDDVERVGDHIKAIGKLVRQKLKKRLWFGDESMRDLMEQASQMTEVVRLTVDMLEPCELATQRARARAVVQAARRYFRTSEELKDRIEECLPRGTTEEGVALLLYTEMLSRFERLVGHCRAIAREMLELKTMIREDRLDRVQRKGRKPTAPPPERVLDLTFREYLARTRAEGVIPRQDPAVANDEALGGGFGERTSSDSVPPPAR